MRREELRLRDILEHIDSALSATAGKDRSKFDADPLLQKAVRYDLQVVGEAASNIAMPLRNRYSNVDWKGICGLRTILAHEYFAVDLDIIWQTLQDDLAPLRSQIEEILRTEFPGAPPSL